MSTTPDPDTSLFQDLTHIFMAMKDSRHVDVEAAVERRLREHMRSAAGNNTRGLQVTLTWALPDGPGDWALQATSYKTLSQENIANVFPCAGKRQSTSVSRDRLRALLNKISGRAEPLERPGIWHQIPYHPTSEETARTSPGRQETAEVVPFPEPPAKNAEYELTNTRTSDRKKGW